jgi:hypothetical protein
MLNTPVSAKAPMMTPFQYAEQALVMVNCTVASATTAITLTASNTTLVHYPSGVTMTDPNFALCESVMVSVSHTGAALAFLYNTTDTYAAEVYALAIEPSISTAFNIQFSYYGVRLKNGLSNVTYLSSMGYDVASYYTNTPGPSCLKSDLGGFSDAIPYLLDVLPSNAYIGITAMKQSGGYDWQYSFFAGYIETISPGLGYAIDFLDHLGVSSLIPSTYAHSGAYYMSTVMAYVASKSTVSFVSCTPGQIANPYISRGWYVTPQGGITNQLTATFYFANDATPIAALTFEFSGTIVPEFSPLMLMVTIAVCTIGILTFKKRFPRFFK